MDYPVYVAKTLTIALTKIGPVVGFIVMGYFIFIKLPFLIFRNSLKSSREFEPTQVQHNPQEFQRFMNSQARLESAQKEVPKQDTRQEKKEEKKEEPKQEKKKASPKQEKPQGISPEENVFQFQAGQRFTQQELKRRYRDLLKQNHPDKVAGLSDEFKNLAEKKTKELNAAYSKLKDRAS